MTTMFLSKYALSGKGITTHDVVETFGQGKRVHLGGFGCFNSFTVGTEAHHTREEAAKAAEAMRVKRIKSLEKQLAALRSMTF